MVGRVMTMSVRRIFCSRVLRTAYVITIFLIPVLSAGMIVKYWQTHAADVNGSTRCEGVVGMCISSIEGNMITANNNPGGYPNDTPSVSPNNNTNFSPAFGTNEGNVGRQTLSINGTGFPDPLNIVADEAKIVKISMVSEACYLSTSNKVYCWVNQSVGDSTLDTRNPTPLDTSNFLPGEHAIDFDLGYISGCLVTNLGNLYCWGGLDESFMNTDPKNPVIPTLISSRGDLPTGDKWTNIAMRRQVNNDGACAISDKKELYCWGKTFGAGGTNNAWSTRVKTPTRVTVGALPATVSSVALGNSHQCATGTDFGIYCWGGNSYGQLGDNTTTNREDPVLAYGTDGTRYMKVVTAGHTTCALSESGQTYCWGANTYGIFGNGTIGNSSAVPIPVSQDGLVFKDIVIGEQYTDQPKACAITQNGAPYCWGTGMLGDGTTSNSHLTPAKVMTSSDGGIMPDSIISIGSILDNFNAGGCAVAIDHHIYCWSSSTSSLILSGNPDRIRYQPSLVTRIPDYITVSFGDEYGPRCKDLEIISTSRVICTPSNAFGGLQDVVVKIDSGLVITFPDSYFYAGYPDQSYDVTVSGKNNSVHIEASRPARQLPYFTSIGLGIWCQYSGYVWVPASYGMCDGWYDWRDWFNGNWPTTLTQYDIVNLKNGTEYKIATQLTIGSPYSISTLSSYREFSVTPIASSYVPDKPTITQLSVPITISCGSGTLSMDWQAPLYNGGSAITNYVPLAKDDHNPASPGSYQAKEFIGNATTFSSRFCPTTSADGSVTTSISVVAVNANGASEPSDPIEIAFLPAGTAVNQPPNVPTNIKVNNVDNSRVMLSWPKPYDNGSAITSFEVRYSTLSDFSDWVDNTANTCISNTPANNPAAACLTTDLAVGDQYYFQVRALSANGASDWSIIHSSIVGAPDRPVLTDITAADSVIDLTWNVPNDNGAVITRYALERATNADFTANRVSINLDTAWIATHCDAAECNYYHDDGLVNGTTYYYRVAAENTRGLSPVSDWLADTPYAPPVLDGDPLVDPDHGFVMGNEIVTIRGTNLNGATAVAIGGNPCKSFSVVDASTIICLTPAGEAGPADVVVTNMGGTDSAMGIYTYVEPSKSMELSTDTLAVNVSANGNTTTASMGVKVKTDDPRGYRLYLSTDTEDNALKAPSAATIPATGRTATAGALEMNRWGYSLLNANNNWLAVPKLSNLKQVASAQKPTEGGMSGAGVTHTVYFGVRVDLSLPIGVYSNRVMYTLTPGT